MIRSRLISYLVGISLLMTIGFPLINMYVFYPTFHRLHIGNTEEEAARTALHLRSMLLPGDIELSIQSLPHNIHHMVKKMQHDFNYLKLKIFSPKGDVLYSTDPEETGSINKEHYFHEIVAKGETFTKTVKKDRKSLENQIVKTDVVETYVPIMKEDRFLGAFEIYYDVTGRLNALYATLFHSSLVPFTILVIFLIINLTALFKLDKSISERKRTEKELKTNTEKLKQSNRELNEFLSIASHDLQEPLRKISFFCDRLATKYAGTLDNQGHMYLERMIMATVRMSRLLSDLHVFTSIVANPRQVARADLGTIAHHVVTDLKGLISQTKGKVEIGNMPTIDGDPLQMQQLLQNLISNALKFARQDEPPIVKVSGQHIHGRGNTKESNADTELYQLIIEDNGIGFEEQHRERIFGVFERLNSRSEYEGTGIGLSVCRKIVERHGGSIAAKSAPDQGSSFIITLPVRQQELSQGINNQSNSAARETNHNGE